MRRQTSATDINPVSERSGPSGIPQSALPTAKRRAEQMPPAPQPPFNRMRMSVAGGPGPSRPQQNTGLAVPGAAQFAPRASMMPGGGGAPQTVRKEVGQFGRTPLKASGLRGAPGTGRPGLQVYGPGKETRPITHKQYQALMHREILDYLVAHRCPIANLSLKTLQAPTGRDFHDIFRFLMKDIDDHFVPGRWGKPEEEVIILLRDLKYPLVDGISKTALTTPGSSSSWPILLAMLHWLVTIAMELPKWEDPEISRDFNLVPAEDIPRDVELPNFASLVTSDYIFKAYEVYMGGSDSFKGPDDDLATIIDNRIEAVIQRSDETERRIAKLMSSIDKLELKTSELVELDNEQKKLEGQIAQFKGLIQDREVKTTKIITAVELFKEQIRNEEAEIAALNKGHEHIMATIAEQGLSVEEVKQMNNDRDNLKRTLEDLLPKSAEAAQTTGQLEIDLGRRSDAIDQMLSRYTSMLYDTELLPTAPEPFSHISFKLELNTAVSNPLDMLKGDDLKNVIHPALSRIAEMKSEERASLEDEKIQADEDLDSLTQRCHKMEEDAEPKENELLVLLKKIEELRMTVAGETAAANAESGKLEQELGSMEMESKQSDVVLTSRKQRLEVECSGHAGGGQPMPDEFRLPTNVKPTHYDLIFKTDLDNMTFQGHGTIDIDVVEDTEEIVLNASPDLAIKDVKVFSEALKTEQTQGSTELKQDQEKERITAKFATPLPKGSKAKLQLGWEGKLGDNMTGELTPTAARKAFPSWDEPLLKAEYTITMISRADTVNLSNMPAVSERPFVESPEATEGDGKSIGKLAKMFSLKSEAAAPRVKGWKITKFEKTPLMSSYLLAFANGHFEHLESSYKSPLSGKTIPLRMYATPEIIHQAAFALDVKAKVMPIYEKVFQLEYPLPKLDTLVAHDFDAGAMENWGLITGRTSAFLVDPKKSDLAAKKRVATVMSHECAHLWFGDLVTMEWWDNLWLNEGFATLMGEVMIIDKVFPQWRVDSDFINAHLARALDLDSVRSSHPIEVPVPDANQINQIFDALSYSKAGSVLRMLAYYVGEDIFLKGVAIYLSKHIYSNSVTRNLWEGIGEASGRDVPKMLDNWILKIGFPVVTVREHGDSITIRQDRFLATGDPTEEENQTIWEIPLSIKTVDADGKVSVDRAILLTEREATIKVDTSRPFKLNSGTTGVYRVAYTPERITKLGEEAAKSGSAFSLEDRMGLVADAFILAKAGTSKTSAALSLVNTLKNEEENLVWSTMASQISGVQKLYWEQSEEVREDIDAFARALYKPLVDKLGYEYSATDSPDTIELRTLAISSAATAKEPSVIAELQSRFKHFVETGDDSKIPADLIRSTYTTAVRHGGRTEYDAVKKVYKNPPTPSAKISAMLAMTASEDSELIDETLAFILTDVQIQDTMYFFAGSASNRLARRKLNAFFKENYDKFMKMFEGNFSISRLITYNFQDLTSEEDAKATEEFFKGKDVSKFNLALAQALDSIHANAKWLERSKGDVTSWLKEWKKQAKL
ncbi:Aminopeptidase 2 mitochondrial [Tulasnella sp. 332]|nr:Aminopeptidase 2 mitochondrial [Tulasnella sp. 332]